MLEALHEMSPSEKTPKRPVTRVVNEEVSTDKIARQEREPSPPSIGIIPSSVEAALSTVGSTSSLSSSSVSVGQRSGRGDGTETEEDEEMVFVGRPKV